MNISTTFLNALKHTSSDVEGQRSPEILLGQIYKVSLEDKGFLLPLAGGEFRLLNPFYYEWNPFPSYLLLYTLEGSALLTTRDNEVILTAHAAANKISLYPDPRRAAADS